METLFPIDAHTDPPFLGVFVHLYSFQAEGLTAVFDELERVGTSAVTVTTRVARPSEAADATRIPPLHLDGYRRVLARPRWGSREPRVEWFSAYEVDTSLYAATPYRPLSRPAPTAAGRALLGRVIEEAHARGMEAHLLVQPTVVADTRPDDRPRRFDGSELAGPRVMRHGALTAPRVREYGLALIEDVLRAAPDVDGLMCDWVEHDAYQLDALFVDFCEHTRRWALARDYDWDTLRSAASDLWGRLQHVTAEDLASALAAVRDGRAAIAWLVGEGGYGELLRLRRETVTDAFVAIRERMDRCGFASAKLSARGWPPPWNALSGMDYRALASICDTVAPKLFTFDYSALPRWYGQQLLDWNPGLDEHRLLDLLVQTMDLPDDIGLRRLRDYVVPEPDTPHPVPPHAYGARIRDVVEQASGKTAVQPFAHAYMPVDQWREMVDVIGRAAPQGMWVQMYSYLDEARLDVLAGRTA